MPECSIFLAIIIGYEGREKGIERRVKVNWFLNERKRYPYVNSKCLNAPFIERARTGWEVQQLVSWVGLGYVRHTYWGKGGGCETSVLITLKSARMTQLSLMLTV